ncbi:MAG: D-alanyl-D-alanine carboxypeptidase family protein [Faecalibacillus sp.]
MKLKRWHLYLLATLCFLLSFTALNFKYDKFYRVNGINNDNRALIELYLDEEEQDYLIENGIAVSQFIDYIRYDEFHLQYYQYYNLLQKAKKYTDIETLLTDANNMADRLTVEFGNGADEKFETLVKYDLEYAYLNSTYFDFSNIRYYQLLRTLYNENDYSYIVLTNTYVNIMEEENVLHKYDQFKAMVSTYNATGVNILLTKQLSDNVKRMYSFDPLTTVINDQTFISNYQPKHMSMIEKIPRLSYSMYLEKDANEALKKMYAAMSQEIQNKMVLTHSYISYDVLSLDSTNQAGYSEYQLGNSVAIKEQGISEEDFVNTSTYQWLIENSYQYGFVLRYPADKEELTGKSSTTVFRYVGVKIAKKLHDNNWCLEEYQENE